MSNKRSTTIIVIYFHLCLSFMPIVWNLQEFMRTMWCFEFKLPRIASLNRASYKNIGRPSQASELCFRVAVLCLVSCRVLSWSNWTITSEQSTPPISMNWTSYWATWVKCLVQQRSRLLSYCWKNVNIMSLPEHFICQRLWWITLTEI